MVKMDFSKVPEPVRCRDCGKFVEANKAGVYACACSWVGFTNEVLSTASTANLNALRKKYGKTPTSTAKPPVMPIDQGTQKPAWAMRTYAPRGADEQKILQYLNANGQCHTKEPFHVVTTGGSSLSTKLTKMAKDGKIKRVKFGVYASLDYEITTTPDEPAVKPTEPTIQHTENPNLVIVSFGPSQNIRTFVDLAKLTYIGNVMNQDGNYMMDPVLDGCQITVESNLRAPMIALRNQLFALLIQNRGAVVKEA